MSDESSKGGGSSKDEGPAKGGSEASGGESKKRKWTAILIGVLVFFALVGSLAAWLQGKASRQPEVDQLTTERDECRDEKADLEDTVADLEGQVQLLEARRQVARAADELGEQNFGSAQQALSEAAEGLRAQGHDAIADRLGEVATTPTDDVSGPRERILEIGRDLDRAIGR